MAQSKTPLKSVARPAPFGNLAGILDRNAHSKSQGPAKPVRRLNGDVGMLHDPESYDNESLIDGGTASAIDRLVSSRKLSSQPSRAGEGAIAAEATEIAVEDFTSALNTAQAVEAPSGQLTEQVAQGATTKVVAQFTEGEFEVGSVFDAPIGLLIEDPMNAREFYTIEDLDDMGESLSKNGQLAPVAAYGKDGKLWVFDGVKRLKAARSAGLAQLRVDVRSRPANDLDIYMISRRMNLERSTQSALDDAVRWKDLLDRQIVPNQQALAQLISKSEGYVSQVLAINRIPRTVLIAMKERPKTADQMIAYKLSCIFRQEAEQKLSNEDLCLLVKEMINEISEKDMNRTEVDRLIERRLGVPKQRARADQQKIKCFGKDGLFKTFPSKGQIEFSVSGLSAEQMSQIEALLKSLVAEPEKTT